MKSHKLDPYEARLLKSFEKGEWVSTGPSPARRRKLAVMARNTLKKDQVITIRLSKQDLNGIRSKAADEGLPYQTLISSLIHKYVSGKVRV